jgi:hypothetical protein
LSETVPIVNNAEAVKSSVVPQRRTAFQETAATDKVFNFVLLLLGSGSDQGPLGSWSAAAQMEQLDAIALNHAVFFDDCGAVYDPLDCRISHMTSPEKSPISALLSNFSAVPTAAVSVDGVPFCGPPIRTKCSEVPFGSVFDAEDPSSARSTGSAFELGSPYGQCNPVLGCGPFDGAFLSGKSTHSSISQQFLLPATAADSSTTGNCFGLYGSSTAYMQDPVQAMQLQADPYTTEAGLGVYSTAAMEASWGGPQAWQHRSMGMPAPAHQPAAWAPTSSQLAASAASGSWQLQHTVSNGSKKRHASDPNDDDEYDPRAGVSWQAVLISCASALSHACNTPAQPAAAKFVLPSPGRICMASACNGC